MFKHTCRPRHRQAVVLSVSKCHRQSKSCLVSYLWDFLSMFHNRYARWSEILRRVTNANFQCSVFCGGKKCKYESFKNWRENELYIPVIFSNWITCDILEMARPNNQIIQEYNLIEFFKTANIKTVINLQQNGEHASCGPALDESGFSYDPKRFMDKQSKFSELSVLT